MSTTSHNAVGGASRQHPTIIELPLVSANPTPKPEWEEPKKGTCPSCGQEVWIVAQARRAMQDTMTRGYCTACMAVERDKQATT